MDMKMPGQYSAINTETRPEFPIDFMLEQNYPNPFNETTTIAYTLPANCHARLVILDMMGREVKLLFDADQSTGFKTVAWDGINNHYQPVSSGVYVFQLIAGKKIMTRKLLLLR